MAEVVTHWPQGRKKNPARFSYPWDHWMILDENGHGDIWLAELGIDFPLTASPARFRAILYDRANILTRKRKERAPLVLKRVTVRNKRTGEISEKMKRVPVFTPVRVKVKIVSDSQVAFQFFEGEDAPPEPTVVKVAVPKRRTPMHKAVTRRTIETRELVNA